MNASDKLLSVCCLGYKHAPFIRDCIASIQRGGYDNIEIVAMDDGSNDGSVEILKELRDQNQLPITILEQENSGNIPANFNKLLKASRGEFILFTSLDDMQLDGALKARMEKLLGDPKMAFCAHAKGLALDENNKLHPENAYISGMAPVAENWLEVEKTFLHSYYIQAAIYRRDALAAVGAFSDNMLGDDIVLRTKLYFWLAKHRDRTFSLIEEPGFIYRRHSGNVSRNVPRQLRLALQYFDKFWKGAPLPGLLGQWLITGFHNSNFWEMMDVMAEYPQLAKFLENQTAQTALRLCAVKSFAEEREECDAGVE